MFAKIRLYEGSGANVGGIKKSGEATCLLSPKQDCFT
jgi:hypothetical protein